MWNVEGRERKGASAATVEYVAMPRAQSRARPSVTCSSSVVSLFSTAIPCTSHQHPLHKSLSQFRLKPIFTTSGQNGLGNGVYVCVILEGCNPSLLPSSLAGYLELYALLFVPYPPRNQELHTMLESLRRSTEYFESSDTGQSEYPRRSSPGMLKSMRKSSPYSLSPHHRPHAFMRQRS